MLDPLEVHLIDFPNIIIKGSELSLPFQAILKLSIFGDLILNATKPKMCLFNLYDDWCQSISPYTAFSRLLLILRALHLNINKTQEILRPNMSIKTKKHHIWPTLTTKQWISVENLLKDLIINDYCLKNSIESTQLTQSEIRDIILGAEIEAIDIQRNKKNDGETTYLSPTTTANVSTKQQEMKKMTNKNKKLINNNQQQLLLLKLLIKKDKKL